MTLNSFGRLCLLACLASGALAQAEYPSQPSLAVMTPHADARALTPILSVPLSDPSICRGPEDAFYLTGSAAQPQSNSKPDAVRVWRSTDLLHWKALGQVWARSGDDPSQGVCSPEIHYIRGAFYVVYARIQGGIGLLKSESGAQGPYEDLGVLWAEGHKPSLFEDTRGQVYLLFDGNKIARLNLDSVALEHEPRALRWKGLAGQDRDTLEGAGLFLFQHNRQYYLFYSKPDVRLGGEIQDTFVAQSNSPYGPFEPGYLAIPHASQTCVFQDEMGHVWATFYAAPQDTWSVLTGQAGLVNLTCTDEGRFRPQANVILEKGAVARMQPRLDKMLVSPSVTVGHDGQYYMVGSNSSWQAPIADCRVTLWRSRDLKTWTPMGDILSYAEDLINESFLDRSVPILSAELMYSQSRTKYYLVFTTLETSAKTWLFHSISDKPDGPFVNVTDSFMVEGVDGFLYEEDEILYLMWSNGKIAQLNQKVTELTGPVHQLVTEDGLPLGTEGMCLVKSGKHYIWTAAEWHGARTLSRTYDLVAAVSESLFGPYKSKQFVMPHAGHSTLFQDDKHQWVAVFSGHDKTAPFRNRPGIMRLDIDSHGTVVSAPER
ncbi:MAG: family 43 glycosylhydrolase [Phycisphaeraceae bacterium]|nr:family 43 glycosylhydrolase [Phycisphaeraceae bacterium]